VKTRLADEVGAARAAELARAFLDDTLALTAEAARENVRATVLASPPESRSRFEELAKDTGVLVGMQCDGDLGARLATGLEAALRGGAPKALAIGSDIPDLPLERIRDALAALDAKDAVLGPARDGGYYLVGVRSIEGARALRAKIAWSTERALEETERAFANANLTVALLAPHDDVDDGPALRALERRLREGKTRAPATAKALGIT
jgi:rSAM/selenodomain-associated transferase 1